MNKQKGDLERHTRRHDPKKAIIDNSDGDIIKKPPVEFKAVFMGGRTRGSNSGVTMGLGDGGKSRRAARVAGTLEAHYIQVCSGSRGLKDIVAMSCGMSHGSFVKR